MRFSDGIIKTHKNKMRIKCCKRTCSTEDTFHSQQLAEVRMELRRRGWNMDYYRGMWMCKKHADFPSPSDELVTKAKERPV